jgi:aminopeptidase N
MPALFRSVLLASAGVSLAACAGLGAPPAEPVQTAAPTESAAVAPAWTPLPALPKDPHSFARADEARVSHVELDLEADFAGRRFAGTAELTVQQRPGGASELVLDTKGLEVSAVTDEAGRPLAFRKGEGDPKLGEPLIVSITPATRKVKVAYATRPDAEALQWLTPAQTAGGRHPFLLSQGQSILTRSWIPTQDSPGIRQTYEARIVVPEPLVAVMSAEMLTPDGEPAGPGERAYRFKLDTAIPPYLIAIAIGDIGFKAVGPRTGVYAERVMLDAAANELAETEKMVEAAEALYGPYRWGRYDSIVLPPSFPFGGMENPRLTFLTPTMIAGDRSLTSLIAHELAHSWSGNLVTNATWDDFWINEGFTTYFENRIMERLYGRDRANMLANLSWQELQAELKNLGPTSPDTRLKIDLAGRHPDEGFSQIPYEKGAHFLRTVEETVGRERLDAWLRSYFDRFAFQPMTTERLIEDMRANLFRGDEERRIGVERWIYQPGVPENVVVRRSDAFTRVDAAIEAFAAPRGRASAVPFAGWTTQERQHFLNNLPRELPAAKLADLDRTFGLSTTGNSEVLFAWLQLALANRYEPAVPAAERFLTSMGRRKFVVPLLRTLMAEDAWGQAHARRIYAAARPGYHPVTYGSADEVMKD